VATATTTDARYERKYHLADGRHQEFVTHLMSLEFSRQHPDRVVNSIYFDGHDRRAFWDKIEGVSERTKFRVRWYGEGGGPISAKLEIKKRQNEVGTKLNSPLPALQDTRDLFRFLGTRDMAKILEGLGQFDLQPIVQIRYLRQYFKHRIEDIRATVDSYVVGSAFSTQDVPPRANFRSIGSSIMEIKYGLDLDAYVRGALIGTTFPFRLHKFSKYSMACGALQL